MKTRLFFLLGTFLNIFSMSCHDTLNCERHFIPKDFTGKVTIYFNQKNGQREFDKDGCIVYRIDKDGNCYTSLPMEQGSAYPNETFKFFEVVSKDSVIRIFEFYKNEYLKDTVKNMKRKYVFFNSSGYSYPNYYFDYYVDYGKNYKRHLYY